MADQQTTQSKYRKKKKEDKQPTIDPNEVRIKGNQGHVKRYVDYACSLLEGKAITKPPNDDDKDDDKKDENEDTENKDNDQEPKKFDTIVLKATGRAINKAVTTAEVVKRRISGLHQETALETLEITDIWEPTEEGLKEVETKRRVASITIKLSRDETEVAKLKKNPGYQPPISNDVGIKPFTSTRSGGYRTGPGRGRGRGGGGYGGGRRRDQREYYGRQQYGRGRGRGRGRRRGRGGRGYQRQNRYRGGGRGRGRGGYGRSNNGRRDYGGGRRDYPPYGGGRRGGYGGYQ